MSIPCGEEIQIQKCSLTHRNTITIMGRKMYCVYNDHRLWFINSNILYGRSTGKTGFGTKLVLYFAKKKL